MRATAANEKVYLVINQDVILLRTSIPGEARAFQRGLNLSTVEVFAGRLIWQGGTEAPDDRKAG